MAARSDAVKNAECNAAVDLCDAGAGAARLELWTNAAPGSVGGSESGNTLCATLPMSDPAFGNAGAVGPAGSGPEPATAGRAYANAITSDTDVDVSGTPGHFRVLDSDNNVLWHGSVGTSGADLNFDSVSFALHGTAAVTSFYYQV